MLTAGDKIEAAKLSSQLVYVCLFYVLCLLFLFLFLFLFVCLFVCLFVFLLFVCLDLCLFVCLFVFYLFCFLSTDRNAHSSKPMAYHNSERMYVHGPRLNQYPMVTNVKRAHVFFPVVNVCILHLHLALIRLYEDSNPRCQ